MSLASWHSRFLQGSYSIAGAKVERGCMLASLQWISAIFYDVTERIAHICLVVWMCVRQDFPLRVVHGVYYGHRGLWLIQPFSALQQDASHFTPMLLIKFWHDGKILITCRLVVGVGVGEGFTLIKVSTAIPNKPGGWKLYLGGWKHWRCVELRVKIGCRETENMVEQESAQ